MNKTRLAFIIGASLGDGNLSNPNKRAVRLRITCDNKYPKVIKEIKRELSLLMNNNVVSIIKRKGCIDISCYSNLFPKLLGWKVGDKKKQKVRIPRWIFKAKKYMISCLRGLILTDGSIYTDRKYKMINLVTSIDSLKKDISRLLNKINNNFKLNKTIEKKSIKYTFRLSKNVDLFIKELDLYAKIK